MSKATNKTTGVTVSGDETVLRRLGSGWVVDGDKPKATRKAPAKKSEKSDEN